MAETGTSRKNSKDASYVWECSMTLSGRQITANQSAQKGRLRSRLYAREFAQGRWSSLGLGDEEMWHGTKRQQAQGEMNFHRTENHGIFPHARTTCIPLPSPTWTSMPIRGILNYLRGLFWQWIRQQSTTLFRRSGTTECRRCSKGEPDFEPNLSFDDVTMLAQRNTPDLAEETRERHATTANPKSKVWEKFQEKLHFFWVSAGQTFVTKPSVLWRMAYHDSM